MAAKVGRGARQKGAAFERKIAKMLTDDTKYEWQSGLGQTRRGGREVSDVYSEQAPEWHIETKRHVKCNIKAAMRHATDDSEGTKNTPIVVTKDDRKEILVTMYYDDWVKLFKDYV